MTIKERIHNTLEEELSKYPSNEQNGIRAAMDRLNLESAIVGACEEQQEMDIKKAVEILKATGYFQNEELREEVMIDLFIKAMKGE